VPRTLGKGQKPWTKGFVVSCSRQKTKKTGWPTNSSFVEGCLLGNKKNVCCVPDLTRGKIAIRKSLK
jgi:hypothetical protein